MLEFKVQVNGVLVYSKLCHMSPFIASRKAVNIKRHIILTIST